MDNTNEPASQGLRGKRYIAYARCAAKAGSSPKLQEQVRLIRQFGDGLGMKCVDEVRLAGVSGRSPALRPDLRQLLARKLERDDFEVLIVEDLARLTRAGLEVGLEIENKFKRHGVQIVYVMSAMPVMPPGETASRVDCHNPPANTGQTPRNRRHGRSQNPGNC